MRRGAAGDVPTGWPSRYAFPGPPRSRASLQASLIPGLFSVGTLETAGFDGVFEVFYRRIGAASDRMFPAEFAERLST